MVQALKKNILVLTILGNIGTISDKKYMYLKKKHLQKPITFTHVIINKY